MEDDPPRPANVPAGYDEEDPYAGEDLSEYPDWWRENVEKFREHGMRPYRPPRFLDDEYTPEVIRELETDLGIDVLIRAIDPRVGDDWTILVNGEDVADVGRHRSGDGYTVYETTSGEFERLVRDAVGSTAIE